MITGEQRHHYGAARQSSGRRDFERPHRFAEEFQTLTAWPSQTSVCFSYVVVVVVVVIVVYCLFVVLVAAAVCVFGSLSCRSDITFQSDLEKPVR